MFAFDGFLLFLFTYKYLGTPSNSERFIRILHQFQAPTAVTTYSS
jgi:hypothetical protein